MFIYPNIQNFKDFFNKDFLFSNSDPTKISDAEIEKAQKEAKIIFNEAFFSDQENFEIAFNYLTAFFVVDNHINSQGAGINASGADFMASGKSVSDISINFVIPEIFAKNPLINMLAKNKYGQKYIMLILPMLIGNVTIFEGMTTP